MTAAAAATDTQVAARPVRFDSSASQKLTSAKANMTGIRKSA